ncbi:hypothetical protein AEAC466_17295 [Asticcacaulis sp. AC466]|uniref:GcrA family cell cycle regulator n=1 Tax=Asticcacaulis sp. AC466 TaxID=1282362 RepID=UPI0003C3D2E5|nr:GcrA family cell cycle regulator [Asticcacaulis sp. AC466]ESQ82378.1 hypothetical protein AEAC466_17295 [Asticcacaulis sp. AC466]
MAMPRENVGWSQERIAQLKQLWPSGLSSQDIATSLNRLPGSFLSRNAVIGKATRMKLGGKAPAASPQLGKKAASPTDDVWAVIDPVLVRDWPDDVPIDTIRNRLVAENPGVDVPDENKIRMRAQRLKLKRTNADKFRREAAVKGRAAIKGDMVEQKFFERVAAGNLTSHTTPALIQAKMAYPNIAASVGIGILDLEDGRCKFILGRDPAGHERYCGGSCARQPRGRFAPWCLRHSKRLIDSQATAKRPTPMPNAGRGDLRTVFGAGRLR